jgi:hypothetical protein
MAEEHNHRRSSPWPTTQGDGSALALCFQGDNISERDSILVTKNTQETALLCVETEKTMYCLGGKAEKRAQMPKSAQAIDNAGDTSQRAIRLGPGKTRRIGAIRELFGPEAAFCSILVLHRSCRQLCQSRPSIPNV